MTPIGAFPNPFRSSIVPDPWQLPETDVPEIHGAAFDRLCRALDFAKAQRRSTSVLLHGGAGSGKTHLLARLRSHLTMPGQEVVFVAVRLQTSPRMIWRHLRSRFAADLLRAAEGGSQLERLILHRLSLIRDTEFDWRRWLRLLQDEVQKSTARIEAAAEALFDFLDPQAQLGGNLRRILIHLLLGRHHSDTSAWLRGESLPEGALEHLGLDLREDEEDEEQEERARQIVLALASLAGEQIPVVFCFDQVEALELYPGYQAGWLSFGSMVGTLHDQTSNALLISCIQTAFVDRLNDAVREADRDRLSEFAKVTINPLNWAEATQLIAARLNSSSFFRERRSSQTDPLWPLREADVKRVMAATGCTARKLLSHCADLLEQYRSDVEPLSSPALVHSPSLEEYLEQVWQRRLDQAAAANSPEQTDQIVAHGLPLLVHLTGKEWSHRVEDLQRDVDLVLSGPSGRIGVILCNRNMRSLWRKLQRLRGIASGGTFKRLVLLRDARLPVSAGAVRTRQLRDELINQGCRWLDPSPEALAALDALRSLLGDAQAGDLANGGETVEPQTVQDWLAKHLPQSLKDLLEDLLEEGPVAKGDGSDLQLIEDITEMLQQKYVVFAADIASALHRSADEVETAARRLPDRFGILTGPPAVLFYVPAGNIES